MRGAAGVGQGAKTGLMRRVREERQRAVWRRVAAESAACGGRGRWNKVEEVVVEKGVVDGDRRGVAGCHEMRTAPLEKASQRALALA